MLVTLWNKKFLKWLLVGGGGWALRLIVTGCLVERLRYDQMTAYQIALALCFVFHFLFCSRVIFGVHDRMRHRLLRYSIVYAVFLGTDGLLMALLSSAGMHYTLALTASSGGVMICKYFIYDKWVFATDEVK